MTMTMTIVIIILQLSHICPDQDDDYEEHVDDDENIGGIFLIWVAVHGWSVVTYPVVLPLLSENFN